MHGILRLGLGLFVMSVVLILGACITSPAMAASPDTGPSVLYEFGDVSPEVTLISLDTSASNHPLAEFSGGRESTYEIGILRGVYGAAGSAVNRIGSAIQDRPKLMQRAYGRLRGGFAGLFRGGRSRGRCRGGSCG